MLIDEHPDRAALNNIQAPAVQRETGLHEITDRESKLNSGVKPSFDNALIVGSDAGQVAWL